MKKIYGVGCLLLLGIGFAACLPEKKKEDPKDGSCSLSTFKEDASIKESFKVSEDPAVWPLNQKTIKLK